MGPLTLNGLDWVLLFIGVFGVLRGIMRGAISQVFGIAGVLGGFLIASHYHEEGARMVARAFPEFSAPQVLVYIILFFIAWVSIATVGYWFGKVLHQTGLGFLDRLTGGVIGFLKAVLLAMVLISTLTFFLSANNNLLRDSLLVPHVQEIARFVVRATPERLQKLFDEKQSELRRYWDGHREEEPPRPEAPKKKGVGI
ncbi:MAG: CvpA family protein [Acidobacteriota bacterium]